jgi:hypothetical protein
MKALYPDAIDDFQLTLTREEYNAGVTDERPLSPLRFAYILQEVERHLFQLEGKEEWQDETLEALNKDQDSLASLVGELQTKMKTVETELDAITEVISIAALAPSGTILIDDTGKVGIGMTPTERLTVQGKIRATDTLVGENGHGQFIDVPSAIFGFPNLRNGLTRYYCIDVSQYVEIEAPDSVSSNRKQYLQDKTGKILVEEPDGLADVLAGLKVNGVQVIASRQAGVSVPSNVPAFTPTDAGTAFKNENEMQDFMNFVENLRAQVDEIANRLRSHGLIES